MISVVDLDPEIRGCKLDWELSETPILPGDAHKWAGWPGLDHLLTDLSAIRTSNGNKQY